MYLYVLNDSNDYDVATNATISNSLNTHEGLRYLISSSSKVVFNNIDVYDLVNKGNATINSGKLNSSSQAFIDNKNVLNIKNISANGIMGLFTNDGPDFTVENTTISNGGHFFLENYGGNMHILDGHYAGLESYSYRDTDKIQSGLPTTTVDGGTFLLEDHSVGNSGYGVADGRHLIMSYGGNIILNGGTFSASAPSTYTSKHVITAVNNSNITINNGTYTTDSKLFRIESGSHLIMNGGNVSVNAVDRDNEDDYINIGGLTMRAKIDINGGVLNINSINHQKASVIIGIYNGEFNINEGGTVNINDLSLTQDENTYRGGVGNAIYINNTGAFNINGGTLNVNNDKSLYIFIDDYNGGKGLSVNNGVFNYTGNDIKAYKKQYDFDLNEYVENPKNILMRDGIMYLKDRNQPIKAPTGFVINYEDVNTGVKATVTRDGNSSILPGDWNEDGVVSIDDVLCYRQYLADNQEVKNEYLYEFDSVKKAAVDLNNDNTLDLVDLVKVRLIAAES